MNTPLAINGENLSKVYRIWDQPAGRIISPLQSSLAGLLPAENSVGRWFRQRASTGFRDFHALQDVSVEVRRGESVGLIGRNGSGKSTLLQIIAGTLQPTTGSVLVNGRLAALLELGSGFNPDFTGRENVYLNASILGLKRREIDERFDTIAAFADIGEFLDEPVKTYSSGMFVRLAFAVATHVSADILLIDEALTVGDIFFQQKCYTHLERLKDRGVAIILVTHGMNTVEQFCSRAYLLHRGQLRASGSSIEVVKRYYLVNQAQPPADATTTPVQEVRPEPIESAISWPASEAFFDLSAINQVSEGTARCTTVALCNTKGEACRVFAQGEEADFYYEFEVLQPIEQPITGLVLFNNRQIIVHGKNSLEYGSRLGCGFTAGQRLRFRQRIRLELAAGEYTFETGFASISAADAAIAGQLKHAELNERIIRHCHLSGLGPFEIVFRQKGNPVQLLHHGIANLDGKIDWLGSIP